jgi:FkbM family methyltransferase
MQEQRLSVIADRGITVVIDVGANSGQYASRLRQAGYGGEIVSVEPLTAAYAALADAAADDPLWQTIHTALGEGRGDATMNVSANSYSSSFLPITDRCIAAAPDAAYVAQETVQVATLDDLDVPRGRALLKIDTQGTEPAVLRGGRARLEQVEAVEVEVSLVPIYDGQELAPAVCDTLRSLGFVPVAIDVAFSDPANGELLQLDLLFARA